MYKKESEVNNKSYPELLISDCTCSDENSDNISLDSLNKIILKKNDFIQNFETFKNLEYISLDPIIITPQISKQSNALNLQQTFTFPPSFARSGNWFKETHTQTSTTLVDKIKNEQTQYYSLSNDMLKKIVRPQSVFRQHSSIIHTRKLGISVSKKRLKKVLQKTEYVSSPRCEIVKNNNSINVDTIIVSPSTYTLLSNAESTYSNNITIENIIEKLNDESWVISLQGLHDLLYIAPRIEWSLYERIIPGINRKLIELFRSPRSIICRVSCQLAGELFRIIKCSKRPEFDEIVNILLCKTADSNKFIRKDANVALDKMVTYIPSFHAVRTLCSRGPTHKNPLVRTSTARLLVCVCAITGINNILNSTANIHTRKRILFNLGKILIDRNQETRKLGERLCKMLSKHKFFDEYFFKDLEINNKIQLKKILYSLKNK